MARVNLNEVVAEGRSVTRQEMNLLFKDYVCETTCNRVISMMEERELKRLLAVHLFDYHVVQLRVDRKLMVKNICIVLDLSKTTIYRWFPAKEFDSEFLEENQSE